MTIKEFHPVDPWPGGRCPCRRVQRSSIYLLCDAPPHRAFRRELPTENSRCRSGTEPAPNGGRRTGYLQPGYRHLPGRRRV